MYSLGLLMYQMIIGDLTAPLGHGWERDVSDANLRRIVAGCVHVEPQRRTDAAHLARALAWWDRWLLRATPGLAVTVILLLIAMAVPVVTTRINNDLYDLWYRLRPVTAGAGDNIALIVVDDASLTQMTQREQVHWPWPREVWARVLRRCNDAGASVIAIDILYVQRGAPWASDSPLAVAIRESRAPVVLASLPDLPITVTTARLGTVREFTVGETVRDYNTVTPDGRNSFALETLRAAGVKVDGPENVLLNFHAATSLKPRPITTLLEEPSTEVNEALRGKVVIIGAMMSGQHPHTPAGALNAAWIETTAVQNLMYGDYVRRVWSVPMEFCAALIAAVGTTYLRSRRARWIAGLAAPIGLLALSVSLFCMGGRICWMPVAHGLLACAAAAIGARATEWWISRRLFLHGQRRPALGTHAAAELR